MAGHDRCADFSDPGDRIRREQRNDHDAGYPITGSAVAIGHATTSDPINAINHGGAEKRCSPALQVACHTSRTPSSGTTSSRNPEMRPTSAAAVSATTVTAETASTPRLLPPARHSAA